jgi:hypothetical protein
MSARLMGRHWVLLLREHLWYFSPATLARLLSHTGFDLIRTGRKHIRFTLETVLVRLAEYPGIVGSVSDRFSRLPFARRLPLW